MSTSESVPNRSSRGCLTCKQRKKKCDEKRPKCDRCLLGGFECLGYDHRGTTRTPAWKRRNGNDEAMHDTGANAYLINDSSSPLLDFPMLHANNGAFSSAITSSDLFSYRPTIWQQEQYQALSDTPLYEPKSIPKNPEPDPFDLENMKGLIASEYGRLARLVSFRPFPYPIESTLTSYLIQGSNLLCKVLYLGARISKALFDDTNWQDYIGWVDTFHDRILGTQSSLITVNNDLLADRLVAHCRLAVFAFMISNSSVGYKIFRKGVPTFLQLAARFPELWKSDSTIFLSPTLHTRGYALAKFVVMDTIAALAFGTSPLIHYDATIQKEDYQPHKFQFLEPVYACPVIVLMTFAGVNASRVSQLMGHDGATAGGAEEYESAVRNWKPNLNYADSGPELVVRLAVQESWRQAALIYLYMGMCGANSADSRVEPLVRQVAQLASTVEAGSPLETHLFVPCLIAGVAARKEKHRTILRKKIQVSQKAGACLLRGADFTVVLDHLWHGAACGGSAVTWDDYVDSRALTLPVPLDV
ncbi:unnamed protein product [Rhizoctonia solani]|uniref:Zn(2)-C6 fungal-type domain-containing protein n=1 Tax=Rhizoctonia solani TaxID=456999 RepID=A0A8H3C334_9AGAM|nr:unnamed protein product [Rhizoctonia solani]